MNSSTCFDFMGNVKNSDLKRCSPRPCGGGYACDCNGTSYCSISSISRQVLEPVSDGKCIYVTKNLETVSLVSLDINEIHPMTLPNKGTCVFNDTQCTCSSTLSIGVIQDCYDFLYEDPARGSVCRVRDCKDSMQCDCGGAQLCSRQSRTIRAYRKTGIEGRPGFVLCEEQDSTSYVVTKLVK